MLTPSERHVLLALVIWLAAGAALDAVLLHRPRALAPWVGAERVADLSLAGPADAGRLPQVLGSSSAHFDSVSVRAAKTIRPQRSRRALAYDERGRLDLNLADSTELELLPGVGPALASRILAARARARRFASPDDLLGVRGIGPRTLAKLLPNVTVRAVQDSLGAAPRGR